MNNKRKLFNYKLSINIFFILYALICIIPFLLIISISLSSEDMVFKYGFSLIPRAFSLDAYAQILKNPYTLIRAYLVTAVSSVGGTAVSISVMAMMGYTLSRQSFSLKKPLTFMLTITMFFSGGLIPSYIVNTSIFHLGNSILIYLIPGVSAYTVFVFRTFFSNIPKSLIEAACLDGASEWKILTSVVIPLSKPVIATFSFIALVTKWNDFTVSMYYITNDKLYTLQYLLQQILNEAKFLNDLKASMPQLAGAVHIPSETLKFGMCVLAVGPMMIIFPFFQKYFAKGMVVGAVKG